MNCPKCGKKANQGQKFCINCGAELNSQTDISTDKEQELQQEELYKDETDTNINDDLSQNKPFFKKQHNKPNPYMIAVLILIGILALAGISFYVFQYNKLIKPLESEMFFNDFGNVKTRVLYKPSRRMAEIRLIIPDNIIEDWQVDFINANDADCQLALKDASIPDEYEIIYSNMVTNVGKPLEINYQVSNITSAKEFEKLKTNIQKNIDNNRLWLSYPYIFNTNKTAKAKNKEEWLKEKAIKQELEEIANRTYFLNIGETDRLYEQSDVIKENKYYFIIDSIRLYDKLEYTSSYKYPYYGYFLGINMKKYNDGRNPSRIYWYADLFDENFNKYNSFDSIFDDSDSFSGNVKINPGRYASGRIFFDIPTDGCYFYRRGSGYSGYPLMINSSDFRGIYIDMKRKEYCINNSIDLIENQDKCTKIVIDKFYSKVYKEITDAIAKEKQKVQPKLQKTREQEVVDDLF